MYAWAGSTVGIGAGYEVAESQGLTWFKVVLRRPSYW